MATTTDNVKKSSNKKKVLIKVFWILLIVTIVEVLWGLLISHSLAKWINALFFLSFTFVKAGYIVAEFMHLRYEFRSLISTILIPLLIFIWFIIAFCVDGGAWLGLRTKFNDKPVEYHQEAKTDTENH